jgi:hypothetical protein
MLCKTALRLTPRGASSVLPASRPRGGGFKSRAPSGARAMAATIFKDVPQAPPDPILVRRPALSSSTLGRGSGTSPALTRRLAPARARVRRA